MIVNNTKDALKLQELDLVSLGGLIIDEQVKEEFTSEFKTIIAQTIKYFMEFRIQEAYKLFDDFIKKWLDFIWEKILNTIFSSPKFLELLKIYGGRKAYKYRRMIETTIYLPSGGRCKIKSPYFIKSESKKKGKRRRGPNGKGAYLGLEVLGFVKNVSPLPAFKAIAYAVVCPSFEFASKLLKQEKINLDSKQISVLCEELGEQVFKNRVKYTLKIGENFSGKRVVITVDGGRSRHRINKRGRRKKEQKRCGFNSDWIEPKLFVIYILNELGDVEKKIEPHVDGAIGVDNFMELLRSYLIELKIEEAIEVTLCADGAPWIWERIPKLLLELGVSPQKLFEVLDYTHGKQNLYEVYEKLSKKQQKKASFKQWKEWLWEGKIEKIKEDIKRICKKGGQKALAKLKSYFEKNKDRMQYKKSEDGNRPCGSGVVESAIRRVINLRLKSCGTFWKEKKLVIMLYLRAQLLYGRWEYLYKNWLQVN